jgi:hypothetical protein
VRDRATKKDVQNLETERVEKQQRVDIFVVEEETREEASFVSQSGDMF